MDDECGGSDICHHTTIRGGVLMKNHPIHPCINCIYFKACGETTRTMPCDGRMTKSEKKKEQKK